MIKYIVHTVTSQTDANGSKHFARVTSTKTGRSLVIDNVGGDQDAPQHIQKALNLKDAEVYSINSTVPVRDWKHAAKSASQGLYEHQVTATMLRALDRKKG